MPIRTAMTVTKMPATLRQHLIGWAGALPSDDEVLVVANAHNAEPGWDRRPQLLTGLADPAGRTVVALPPDIAAEAGQLLAHRRQGSRPDGLLVLPGLLGKPGCGVGIKRHDHLGHEISVGTEPRARGHGLARRLVAQAARHILDQGRIPTYLHTFDNLASSRVATAAGFPDLGWSALMLSDEAASIGAASSGSEADVAA